MSDQRFTRATADRYARTAIQCGVPLTEVARACGITRNRAVVHWGDIYRTSIIQRAERALRIHGELTISLLAEHCGCTYATVARYLKQDDRFHGEYRKVLPWKHSTYLRQEGIARHRWVYRLADGNR